MLNMLSVPHFVTPGPAGRGHVEGWVGWRAVRRRTGTFLSVKAGSRSLPLLPVLDQELRKHRQTQLGRGLAGSDQLVFTTAAGCPARRNRGIVRAAKKAEPTDVI